MLLGEGGEFILNLKNPSTPLQVRQRGQGPLQDAPGRGGRVHNEPLKSLNPNTGASKGARLSARCSWERGESSNANWNPSKQTRTLSPKLQRRCVKGGKTLCKMLLGEGGEFDALEGCRCGTGKVTNFLRILVCYCSSYTGIVSLLRILVYLVIYDSG